jgi:hypothetical protein
MAVRGFEFFHAQMNLSEVRPVHICPATRAATCAQVGGYMRREERDSDGRCSTATQQYTAPARILEPLSNPVAGSGPSTRSRSGTSEPPVVIHVQALRGPPESRLTAAGGMLGVLAWAPPRGDLQRKPCLDSCIAASARFPTARGPVLGPPGCRQSGREPPQHLLPGCLAPASRPDGGHLRRL